MSRRHAAMPTYVFRVRILGGYYAPPRAPSIWREVELAGEQTLAELGERIPAAFGFDDDLLWSFFLSGKPWDRPASTRASPTRPLAGPSGVKLVRTGEVEPGARYPRVVASQGQAPPQYPDLDDEDDRDGALLPELGPPRFAPVEVAPPPVLRAAAASAPTVQRLRALVDWLGEGHKLTAAGNLRLADGEELARLLGLVDPDRLADLRVRSARDIAGLELLVGWAKQLRLVRVHEGSSYRSSSTGAFWTIRWSCSIRPPPSCPCWTRRCRSPT
jgi:hypothetical protein